MTTSGTQGGVQGEGDYVSAKRFDDEEAAFVKSGTKSGKLAKKAREAAEALDGPEGPELERARALSAQGESRHRTGAGPEHVKDERDPHTEKNLDKGLEETFPASDPVSISPGAD
ncbi:MAG TPA: hypothetical protein VHZ26_06165 [Caulobacteraceae bacterium]|jgi:hypothetical protein|nr:hypothetical protein [Caulobacteraceae bacterium]